MAKGPIVAIEGADQLRKNLRSLDDKLRRKLIRDALRKGAQPIYEEARRLVPVRTGALQASINIKASTTAKRVRFRVQTGAEGFFKGKTYYGGFVEFGHKIGSRKLGDKRKEVPPHPFMGDAFDERGDEARRITLDELKASAEREANRIASATAGRMRA